VFTYSVTGECQSVGERWGGTSVLFDQTVQEQGTRVQVVRQDDSPDCVLA
jgi:hypothetical protein